MVDIGEGKWQKILKFLMPHDSEQIIEEAINVQNGDSDEFIELNKSYMFLVKYLGKIDELKGLQTSDLGSSLD